MVKIVKKGVIVAKNLTKKFGELVALDNLDLEVEEHEFFGFLGPNGAGKTTALKILTGQMEPSSGYARVLGMNPTQEPVRIKENIGIVPEEEVLPSFLTVLEYMRFVCKVRRMQDAEGKIRGLLKFFEIEEKEDVLCNSLSRGEKHKVMLSSALIHEPDVLFLDEPLSGLDPISQIKTVRLLKQYAKEHGGIFMCTHMLDLAEKVCTRAGIIHRGRLLAFMRNPKRKSMEQFFSKMVSRSGGLQ